jgi:hypothetical protein
MAKLPLFEALHPESIPEYSSRGQVLWTRGQWFQTMKELTANNGIMPYQNLISTVFPSSKSLDSLVNYGLVFYRPTHTAALLTPIGNVHDPAIMVSNPVSLQAMKSIIQSPPLPCKYLLCQKLTSCSNTRPCERWRNFCLH